MALRPKHQRFVLEYLKDLNATQAAIRAGYSAKTAAQQAFKLLRNAQIASAIAEKQHAIEAKVSLSIEECYANLAQIAQSGESDRDKISATTALLKLKYKVAEKVEHSGAVTIVVADPYAAHKGGDEGAK